MAAQTALDWTNPAFLAYARQAGAFNPGFLQGWSSSADSPYYDPVRGPAYNDLRAKIGRLSEMSGYNPLTATPEQKAVNADLWAPVQQFRGDIVQETRQRADQQMAALWQQFQAGGSQLTPDLLVQARAGAPPGGPQPKKKRRDAFGGMMLAR